MKIIPEWIKEWWTYRELLLFLAWRDIKVRYKQAALGAGWAILQPLLTMIIFTLFFGKLAHIQTGGIPYPLFSYCALVPWTYFSVSLGQGGNSLVSNANLITKVYFPRAILPASTVVSGLLDLFVSSAFLVVLLVYYHVAPTWRLLWIPAFLGVLLMFTFGVSMLLAGLNVKYRDVKYAIPFLIQLWLFVTPVIYPMTMLPKRFQPVVALNPLSGIVEGFRACLFPGHKLDPTVITASLAAAAAVFLWGFVSFRKTERVFADII